MATSTLTTPSGSKLRTQTQRRYVVVAEYVEGKPFVQYRTDDISRARVRRARVGRAAVVFDTVTKEIV